MAVIPESHVRLMRTRKRLKQLVEAEDWASVAALERELFQQINQSASCSSATPKELLLELKGAISLYKELTILCQKISIGTFRNTL